MTLENCSVTTVPFASFSLFDGTLTVVPDISHPQTPLMNLSNAPPVMPSHDSKTLLSILRTDCEMVSAIRMRMSSSKPATSAMRSAYRSSLSRVLQKAAYDADPSRLFRTLSFCTASERGASPAAGRAEDVLAGVEGGGGQEQSQEKGGGQRLDEDIFSSFVYLRGQQLACCLF